MNNNNNNPFDHQQSTRSRSRDRPLVSPRSENPWRPQFDQGSDQTNHFHDPNYDSETSNRNRLLFSSPTTTAATSNNSDKRRPLPPQSHMQENRRRSPAFPTNWEQPVNHNNNNLRPQHNVNSNNGTNGNNNNNEVLENYLRQPLANSNYLPQNAQRYHQQQLLEKYIKHIDSEGEWHPSSNDNSFQSAPSNSSQQKHQQQRKPTTTSSRASDREYEADRSTNYINNNKNDGAKSPRIQRELSPAARKNHEKAFEDTVSKYQPKFGQQNSFSSTRSPSVSSSAVAQANAVLVHSPNNNNNNNNNNQNQPLPSYEQSKKPNSNSTSFASPSTNNKNNNTSSFSGVLSPMTHPKNSNNVMASSPLTNNKQPQNNNNSAENSRALFASPKTSTASTVPLSEQPQFFKKEIPRDDFYRAATDQQNPLGPREEARRKIILDEEDEAAELLFRKIFGLLGFYWEEERKLKIEEKKKMLEKVISDAKHKETKKRKAAQNKTTSEKTKRKSSSSRPSTKDFADDDDRGYGDGDVDDDDEENQKHIITNDPNGTSDELYLQNLIKKLKSRTQEVSAERKQRLKKNRKDDDDDDEDKKTEEDEDFHDHYHRHHFSSPSSKQKNNRNNRRHEIPDSSSSSSSSYSSSDDEKKKNKNKNKNNNRHNVVSTEKNPILFEKNQALAKLLIQSRNQRARAQLQTNENHLLQHWLALPSNQRYRKNQPIELTLTEIGEKDMRTQIVKAEQVLRDKLKDVFLSALKKDWKSENTKHLQQDILYVKEKEQLKKLVVEHDETKGKLMDENFRNIVNLRRKLNEGQDANLLQVRQEENDNNINSKKKNEANKAPASSSTSGNKSVEANNNQNVLSRPLSVAQRLEKILSPPKRTISNNIKHAEQAKPSASTTTTMTPSTETPNNNNNNDHEKRSTSSPKFLLAGTINTQPPPPPLPRQNENNDGNTIENRGEGNSPIYPREATATSNPKRRESSNSLPPSHKENKDEEEDEEESVREPRMMMTTNPNQNNNYNSNNISPRATTQGFASHSHERSPLSRLQNQPNQNVYFRDPEHDGVAAAAVVSMNNNSANPQEQTPSPLVRKFCSECGTPYFFGKTRFCQECGNKLLTFVSTPSADPSRLIAAISPKKEENVHQPGKQIEKDEDDNKHYRKQPSPENEPQKVHNNNCNNNSNQHQPPSQKQSGEKDFVREPDYQELPTANTANKTGTSAFVAPTATREEESETVRNQQEGGVVVHPPVPRPVQQEPYFSSSSSRSNSANNSHQQQNYQRRPSPSPVPPPSVGVNSTPKSDNLAQGHHPRNLQQQQNDPQGIMMDGNDHNNNVPPKYRPLVHPKVPADE